MFKDGVPFEKGIRTPFMDLALIHFHPKEHYAFQSCFFPAVASAPLGTTTGTHPK